MPAEQAIRVATTSDGRQLEHQSCFGGSHGEFPCHSPPTCCRFLSLLRARRRPLCRDLGHRDRNRSRGQCDRAASTTRDVPARNASGVCMASGVLDPRGRSMGLDRWTVGDLAAGLRVVTDALGAGTRRILATSPRPVGACTSLVMAVSPLPNLVPRVGQDVPAVVAQAEMRQDQRGYQNTRSGRGACTMPVCGSQFDTSAGRLPPRSWPAAWPTR